MSIIHDALKKVQQGRTPKADPTPIWAEPAKQTATKTAAQKSSIVKMITSLLAMLCAMAITVVVFSLIFQQFQKNMPKAQKWAKDIPKVKKKAMTSLSQLIHKMPLPDFKTGASQEPKPLAQLIVPSLAAFNTTQPHPSLTLNIQGVMATDDHDNLVLINDQVYREGDEINGAKITKINLNAITIINNGKEETISVGK